MKKYSFCVRIEGLNFERLFTVFNKQKIKMYNYIRPNYKTCEFCLSFLDFLKMKKIKLIKQYKLTLLKSYNLGFLYSTFLKNVGLYVGGIVATILILFFSKFTLKINVMGTENISELEIISQLKNINVSVNKINNATNEEIEQYLKQNNNKISLVSVQKKGTNLIINIKEKILKMQEDVSPICAPYNMVIKSINVVQGVANVKVDDVVKKGDVLVYPQTILSSGEVVELKPIANIESTVWVAGAVEHKNEEITYKKTGKKQIISNYELCGLKLFSSTAKVKFEKYEKSVYNNYVFNNLFLPLKLNKVVYHQLKAEKQINNFDKDRENLILKSKEIAYSKLPVGYKAVNENTVISETATGHVVTTYLEIQFKIEG